MSANVPKCPQCTAELPAAAKFCPQCGVNLAGIKAAQDNVRRCVICSRTTAPGGFFRCPLCGRDGLCNSHLVNKRTWDSGGRKVTIPTCCEVCFGAEYARNRVLIDALKKEKSCAVCQLVDSEFVCKACGKHYCARHAQERMLLSKVKDGERVYHRLWCRRCGEVCTACAVPAGASHPGVYRCRKCGNPLVEEPGARLRELLVLCVSRGYLSGYAPKGLDEQGMPR